MSAQYTHDIMVKTGEYVAADGQTKGRWLKIGTVFKHQDGGTSIKFDCLPVGLPDWNGFASVFPRRPPQGQATPQVTPHATPQAHPPQNGGYGQEDIPF